jgi:hypothetical protein
VKAAALSDNSGTVTFWPRVLITQDLTGTTVFCEYGDGSTGTAPATLTKQAGSASPSYLPVQLNIGGSADCPGAPTTTGGDVDSILVPEGHYNVHATFSFSVNGTMSFVAGD